ncbi:site-specific integrase [Botrimarina sp.]|uniref:tyrosine-type recombinase/integrase n=1 Tax=Botrimarina sp. TaxID=2795802 RepID=UPI0032EF7919
MSETITVHVVKYPGRTNLMMRYRCPVTRKQVARSTGTAKRREAEKAAAKWEAELREGRYQRDSRMGWAEFRVFYETNALAALAPGTRVTYCATLNRLERFCRPDRLADVTTARVTAFVAHLRAGGCSEATVARHLRAIKAVTRWAVRQGLLSNAPQVEMPKRARGAKVMRGRPITTEEFERMLTAVPKVVAEDLDPEATEEEIAADPRVAAWRFYLRGLWHSGLRLTESLSLSWEDRPGAIVVDLEGDYPMLRIPAEAEKAHRDRMLPMTPELVELLQSVPARQRRGRVFNVGPDASTVCRTVAAFGETARVVVDDSGGKRKFASAHDLRRAFGARWSRKVMPTVLREMMRHSSLQTTMAYYVGDDANETAKALWATVAEPELGNTQGNTRPESTPSESGQNGRKSLHA